jgi:hypothetical protein
MKTFVEASFKVDVAGLPPIFMDAKSSVEIRKKLRRQLKFPDDIENIERVTKGEKIKSFKDRLKSTLSGKGQDVKEDYSKGLDGKKLKASKSNKPLIAPYEEDKASEDMLINPKKMAKKSSFLSPQNTDKLKTDMARLKKALGPNHPMNKDKSEACWSGYKQVGMKKKGNRQVPNCVPEDVDLEEKKKKLTRAQRNKKMRATDRAKERRIRKGNPFNVQI